MNPFYYTRYLSFPLTLHLFSILSTFYSSSPSIITRAGCSFLCPFTCPIYLCILLMFTTGHILIVLDNSNSTTFANTIFLTYRDLQTSLSTSLSFYQLFDISNPWCWASPGLLLYIHQPLLSFCLYTFLSLLTLFLVPLLLLPESPSFSSQISLLLHTSPSFSLWNPS